MATKTTRAARAAREPLAIAHSASCGCGAHVGAHAGADDGEGERRAVGVDTDIKDRNLKRLRRIEGQVRGLQRIDRKSVV